jgi:hypothetical protein
MAGGGGEKLQPPNSVRVRTQDVWVRRTFLSSPVDSKINHGVNFPLLRPPFPSLSSKSCAQSRKYRKLKSNQDSNKQSHANRSLISPSQKQLKKTTPLNLHPIYYSFPHLPKPTPIKAENPHPRHQSSSKFISPFEIRPTPSRRSPYPKSFPQPAIPRSSVWKKTL